MTNILPASDTSAIEYAAQLLQAGEVVAFPTETVYGLAASALNPAAIEKIYAVKGRPATDPLIVHIAETAMLRQVVAGLPRLAKTLQRAFWPGPLTLVLPRRASIPIEVSAGLPTIAVRWPSHPVAQALIRAAGLPIVAPSANLFAHTSPTTAQHVLDDLKGRIPVILDGGPTDFGLESTIVDLTTSPPRLLRPGALPIEALLEYIPDLNLTPYLVTTADQPVPAPGMLIRHYAPRARLTVFQGAPPGIYQALRAFAQARADHGEAVGLLLADEDLPALADLADDNTHLLSLGPLADPGEIAHGLFAALRQLDSTGVAAIAARTFPSTGLGRAINDRLLRAAEGRLVTIGE